MTTKHGIVKTNELKPAEYRRFLDAVSQNEEVIKIKNGVYATLDALANDTFDIDRVIPGGILCMYSAWSYYGMTTQIPDSFYVAIDRKRKVRLPSMPAVTLVYINSQNLNLGVAKEKFGDCETLIYDRERCICDAIKYRNKIGIDVMAEIITWYLKYPKRDLDKLCKYASCLRVLNILKRYLEIYV